MKNKKYNGLKWRKVLFKRPIQETLISGQKFKSKEEN